MTFSKLIGVDWGSSYLRVYLLDDDATVIGLSSSKQGILYTENHFADVLTHHLKKLGPVSSEWPILMCGMIGSNKGWVETHYLQCPALTQDFALQLERVVDQTNTLKNPMFIVPGLRYINKAGQSDFIRGEETQLLGALCQTKQRHTLFCIPGTHSKWVLANHKTIMAFRTYLTGELYQLLYRYPSSLAMQATIQSDDSTFHESAFESGLDQSKQSNCLLHDLFQIRVKMIEGRLVDAVAHADFLSGLLVGSELGDALSHHLDETSVHLIANASLAKRYRFALNYFGRDSIEINSCEATIAGLIDIRNHCDFACLI